MDGYSTLSEQMQEKVRVAAEGRYSRRRASGSEHKWNRRQAHTLGVEIDSCGAEAFAAEVCCLTWEDSHVPDKAGDIGEGMQVRHTVYESGHLIVHRKEDDNPEHVFFLVIGRFPRYRLAGWLFGWEAQSHEEWFRDLPGVRGRRAFNCPQSALHRLSEWLEPL